MAWFATALRSVAIAGNTNQNLRRRDRRHYGYQSTFGNHAGILYDLKNVCYIHTQDRPEHWSKHRRKYLEHTYPSFFMNIRLVPTYQWECSDFEESDEWTST